MDIPVCACAGIETPVKTAIGIEPGNVGAVVGIRIRSEKAPDDRFAIGLHGDGKDRGRIIVVGRLYPGIETAVQTSIGIETSDSGVAADEDLEIGLQRD